MNKERYPVIAGHVISYNQATENINRCHVEKPRLDPAKFLDFFWFPSDLYQELNDLFVPVYGKVNYRKCIGVDAENKACPIILVTDEKGNLLPWPAQTEQRVQDSKQPAALNVAGLCPPFCQGGEDGGNVSGGDEPENPKLQ